VSSLLQTFPFVGRNRLAVGLIALGGLLFAPASAKASCGSDLVIFRTGAADGSNLQQRPFEMPMSDHSPVPCHGPRCSRSAPQVPHPPLTWQTGAERWAVPVERLELSVLEDGERLEIASISRGIVHLSPPKPPPRFVSL
jgi:hypothetical protein